MSGFKVEFSVLNLKATPGIYADALASRPAAGYPGRVFIDTDNPSTGIYRDTGTVWVQIAETAAVDTDTLQTVTDRGNTTTQSISVGHASTPVAIIDARTPFTNLNNADSFCVAANTARNITSNASFGVNYVNTVYGFQSLVFNGNATIGNGGINSAGNFINFLNNNTTGTVSVTQAATIRAIAGTQTGIYYNTGAASTVFTHVAALKTLQPINTGSLPALVTNNYGLLVADNTASSGTITYTNRWGIYQEGASDKNYFAANVLIKSNTDNGNALQVTGNGYISGNLGIGTTSPTFTLDAVGSGRFTQNQNGITAVVAQNNNLTNGAGQAFRFYYDGITPIGGIFNQYNSTTFAYDLSFSLWDGTSATNRLFINGLNGNVGIGTTNPTNTLDVRGTILSRADNGYFVLRRAAGTDVGYITDSGTWGDSGTDFSIGASSANLRFYTNNSATERIRITSDGELLINTTTDVGDFKLQVSGNSYVSGNLGIGTNIVSNKLQVAGGRAFIQTGNENYTLGISRSGANAYYLGISNSISPDLYFSNNAGTTRVTFTDGGSVGINTTSPNASAILQMDSTTQGILIPRMTATERDNIATPAIGLLIFNTTTNRLNIYDGAWIAVH